MKSTSQGREVVVTGIGAILPGCDEREELWRQLREGDSQLRLEKNPSAPERSMAVGRVRDFEPGRYLGEIPERLWSHLQPESLHYLASVFRARDDAGLELAGLERDRVGVFDGASRPAFAFWYDRLGARENAPYSYRDLIAGQPGQTVGLAASLLKVQGPAYVYNGTCSSGGIAIGHAFREIRDGEIDVAFATGHEGSLLPPLFAMYGDAGLLNTESEDARRAVRPYGYGSGNAFGEGSVTLLLEERTHAERRGAKILAKVSGYAFGNNGDHPTKVDTSGERPARLISRVLGAAGLTHEDVGFVVGHGNAVAVSDAAEAAYVRHAFGERSKEVPLLSIKPIYGHLLGASSALNAAAAALMLHHEHLVPTLNSHEATTGLEHLASGGRAAKSRAGLAMSFGMGGQNCALLLQHYDPETER